jgi:hypothetical protein
MKKTKFKVGSLCYWFGLNPGFCIILGDCESFEDSYKAFDLNEMTSTDISLNENNLRLAFREERKNLKQIFNENKCNRNW